MKGTGIPVVKQPPIKPLVLPQVQLPYPVQQQLQRFTRAGEMYAARKKQMCAEHPERCMTGADGVTTERRVRRSTSGPPTYDKDTMAMIAASQKQDQMILETQKEQEERKAMGKKAPKLGAVTCGQKCFATKGVWCCRLKKHAK